MTTTTPVGSRRLLSGTEPASKHNRHYHRLNGRDRYRRSTPPYNDNHPAAAETTYKTPVLSNLSHQYIPSKIHSTGGALHLQKSPR